MDLSTALVIVVVGAGGGAAGAGRQGHFVLYLIGTLILCAVAVGAAILRRRR